MSKMIHNPKPHAYLVALEFMLKENLWKAPLYFYILFEFSKKEYIILRPGFKDLPISYNQFTSSDDYNLRMLIQRKLFYKKSTVFASDLPIYFYMK